MLVRDFMTRPLFTAGAAEKAGPVLQRMREEGVRRMPVLDGDGNLVGIVSDRRLLRALAVPARRGELPSRAGGVPSLTVADIMNADPVTTSPETPLELAAAQMTEKRIGSLVVIDQGAPVGIITETDMFRVFLRLLVGDRQGLRVTVRVPAFPGVLADITNGVVRAGGQLLSLGSLTEGDDLLVSFKVAELGAQDLADVLDELPVQGVDIRPPS